MSAIFRLDKSDNQGILKVIGYTIATAVVVALIDLLSGFEFPVQYLWFAPVVNTLLVTAKKFFESQK